MALNTTIKTMKQLLGCLTNDLEKAETGNKAASQRVRTSTVRLEKVAKLYRKESIAYERTNPGKKAKKSKIASPKKTSGFKKTAGKTKTRSGALKMTIERSVCPKRLVIHQATAKLPTKG